MGVEVEFYCENCRAFTNATQFRDRHGWEVWLCSGCGTDGVLALDSTQKIVACVFGGMVLVYLVCAGLCGLPV